MNFYDMIQRLENIGVFDVLFPFILIFAILFALMQKIQVLGEGDEGKKYNLIVALVIAAGVVLPHVTGSYPQGMDPIEIMLGAFPNIIIVIMGILGLFLIMGMWGLSPKWENSSFSGLLVLVAIAVVVFIFGTSAGWWWNFPSWLNFLNDSDTQALLVTLLVFGVVIYLIVGKKSESGGAGKSVGNFLEGASKMWEKK